MPESHASPEQFAGWLPQEQRADTTPLARDNTRVNRSDATAVAGPATPPAGNAEDVTRPAFPQRPPSPPHAGYGAPPPAPSGYPQAAQQAPQPPVQPPYAATPIPSPSPSSGRRITVWGWVLRGLILCAISLVSGLIWHAIKPHHSAQTAAPPPAPHTKYQFTPAMPKESTNTCQNVSTGQIKEFFAQHPCEHLTRALYTTTLPDGQKVLTSVITVLMPDPATAQQLYEKDKQNIGTIDALKPPSSPTVKYPRLYDQTFEDQQQGSLVVIGDSSYFNRTTQPYKDPTLVDVTTDALQLGWPQDGTPQK